MMILCNIVHMFYFQVLSQMPYFRLSGGRNHIFVFPRYVCLYKVSFISVLFCYIDVHLCYLQNWEQKCMIY